MRKQLIDWWSEKLPVPIVAVLVILALAVGFVANDSSHVWNQFTDQPASWTLTVMGNASLRADCDPIVMLPQSRVSSMSENESAHVDAREYIRSARERVEARETGVAAEHLTAVAAHVAHLED